MNREEIKGQIFNILKNNFQSLSDKLLNFNENTVITNALGFDSLDKVKLIICIENIFTIAIPDKESDRIKTVGDLVTLIFNKITY